MLLGILAIGTPMLLVNCKSGLSKIIIDRFNGLLIENLILEYYQK